MLITKPVSEAPNSVLCISPETVPMSLLLSALWATGMLECIICSYFVMELAGGWLLRLMCNKNYFFSRAVAGSTTRPVL
jgi:hypothetical protein